MTALISPFARLEDAGFIICTGLFDDQQEDAGRVSAAVAASCRPRLAYGLRQSGHHCALGRQIDLLRWRFSANL